MTLNVTKKCSTHFGPNRYPAMLYIFLILNAVSISIIFSSSPLILGVWVILISLSLTLFLCTLIPSWFSFLIFLIYIGGLLVMFSYFVAIQPNQQLGIAKIMAISRVSGIYLHFLTNPLIKLPHRLSDARFSLRTIMSTPRIFIIILIGISLFLALIVVVKMTSLTKGPLRPYSYV